MPYSISNPPRLKKLLWVDAALGTSNGLAGVLLLSPIAGWFGLAKNLLLLISIITLGYAAVALYLATRPQTPPTLAQRLVQLNWLWTGISVLLLLFYHKQATTLGDAFLVAQVLVVGGLAYLEGRQICKQES